MTPVDSDALKALGWLVVPGVVLLLAGAPDAVAYLLLIGGVTAIVVPHMLWTDRKQARRDRDRD